MKIKKVTVALPGKSYPIIIGEDLSARLKNILGRMKSRNAYVISDRALSKARKTFVNHLKEASWKVTEIPVLAGEGLKDFREAYSLYGKLLKSGAQRDAVIFALGGGSVGDAVGFVASTYLRGVAWVGVPTTLLAQVDSAIGGKTAVNHDEGKNLIGTFHQPTMVLSDVSFLKTLSEREMISGLGEALKYGIVYDPVFYNVIKKNWRELLAHDAKLLEKIVERSSRWKAKVVALDEFDKKGVREFLNFGHTIGHSLENLTGYKVFQHGEAIIWGMRFALALSQVRGHLKSEVRETIDAFLAQIKIPPWPKTVSFQKLLGPLSHDKKNRNGRLHFVLLKNLGHPITDAAVTPQHLRAAFDLVVGRAGQG